MIDGSEIAEMFAELDGRDRLDEWLQRVREHTEHGYHAYTKHGCRCDVCRNANAEYMRTYNKLRRRRDPEFRAKRTRYEANRRARAATAKVASRPRPRPDVPRPVIHRVLRPVDPRNNVAPPGWTAEDDRREEHADLSVLAVLRKAR